MSTLAPSDRALLRTLVRLKLQHTESPSWHELARKAQMYHADLFPAMIRLQEAGFVGFDADTPRSFRVMKPIEELVEC